MWTFALAAACGCAATPVETPMQTAQRHFPVAATVGPASADGVRTIRGPSGVLGYVVDETVRSKSTRFAVRVVLDGQFRVVTASVLSYPGLRGAGVRRRSFARQFEGKGPGDSLEVGRDIDAVTGATSSSRAMAAGVRRAIDRARAAARSYGSAPAPRVIS